MSRRSFLRLVGALGSGLGAGCSSRPQASDEFQRLDGARGEMRRVADSRPIMGTFVSIIALSSSRLRAQEGVGAAYEEIERLTQVLGRFGSATPLASLNREGRLDRSPPELLEVIASALACFRLSGGVFDISVQPVVDLFREQHAAGRLPAPEALGRALELVNAADIRLDRRCVRFARPGMGITLDGIAKGYVVDKASAVLSSHGIEDHLVDAGGDIRARGHPSRGRSWSVAVRHPESGGLFPSVIELSDGAIATSGNYEIHYDRERLFHHIISPATGVSPLASASVSVQAPTAMEADALSTAVFVMEPARGTAFIDSLPACECLVLDRQSGRHLSRGWPSVIL